MSYVRFSNRNSDVYVYADVRGGWTTHVAERRRVRESRIRPFLCFHPESTTPESERAEVFNREYYRHLVDDNVLRAVFGFEDVESEFAGMSYNDPTPGQCADRLEQMRGGGILVPQYAITALREEDDGETEED